MDSFYEKKFLSCNIESSAVDNIPVIYLNRGSSSQLSFLLYVELFSICLTKPTRKHTLQILNKEESREFIYIILKSSIKECIINHVTRLIKGWNIINTHKPKALNKK